MRQQYQALTRGCVALIVTLTLSSCTSQSIPGIQNSTVGVQNHHLYADFIATTLQTSFGLTMAIPNLPGATLGINPYLPTDGSGISGTLFQFDIDLSQLHGKIFGAAGLPDGRPLPDVDGGALPRWTFSIKNVDVYVYLADGALGIFVPIDLSANGVPLQSLLSQEIDDERGNVIGKVYAIPAQGSGSQSGLFLLVPYVSQPASS